MATVFTVGMLYILFSVDWRGRKPLAPPRVALEASAKAEGWKAGAAKVELDPALPATVAGYPPKRPTAKTAGPLSARAVVLAVGDKEVALVGAEVLEIPARVAKRVRERARALGLADAAVAATHTHSSFGGYDRSPLVEIAATGKWEQKREDALAARLEEAVEKAHRALAPAGLRAAQLPLTGLAYNRDRDGAPVEGLLTVLAVEDAAGKPLARLAVFGSHATLVPRGGEKLDGDWPGRAMAALEKDEGTVALLLQGAMGDASSDPPKDGEGEPVDRMGARVAQAVRDALAGASPVAPALGWAAVEVGMPRAEAEHAVPGFLRVPAANVLHAMAPRKVELSVLRVQGLAVALLPAEPTTALAAEWRARFAPALPAGEKIAFVSLAQGYIGYVETAEAMRTGAGEAKRVLFTPELAEQLAGGISLGLTTAQPPAVEAAK